VLSWLWSFKEMFHDHKYVRDDFTNKNKILLFVYYKSVWTMVNVHPLSVFATFKVRVLRASRDTKSHTLSLTTQSSLNCRALLEPLYIYMMRAGVVVFTEGFGVARNWERSVSLIDGGKIRFSLLLHHMIHQNVKGLARALVIFYLSTLMGY
jgi:hypothetical protein